MALESQGIIIRRNSSAAGTTAALSTDTISFDSTQGRIDRQAGFGDFSVGMRVEIESSLNSGVWTISATAGTYIGVYEPLTAQSSGGDVSLTGYAMQEIGQIVSFNGPQLSANFIDITNLKSTAKEKMIALQDAGNMDVSVLFNPNASDVDLHDALIRDLRARTQRRFDIKFTDAAGSTAQPSAVYFAGYVANANISGAVDDVLKGDISVAITSRIDWIDKVSS